LFQKHSINAIATKGTQGLSLSPEDTISLVVELALVGEEVVEEIEFVRWSPVVGVVDVVDGAVEVAEVEELAELDEGDADVDEDETVAVEEDELELTTHVELLPPHTPHASYVRFEFG